MDAPNRMLYGFLTRVLPAQTLRWVHHQQSQPYNKGFAARDW